MARKKVNITIAEDTHERLKQYAYENHIANGVSGAVEDLIWKAKIKNDQVKGQMSFGKDKN